MRFGSRLLRARCALIVLLLAASAPRPSAATAATSRLAGRGWVVWESNRSGGFRIWSRALEGGPERQLSIDEPGRDHCCAHLSPDGARVVYLSIPDGGGQYTPPETLGELRLVPIGGGAHRVLVPAARHYGGHRAAVWWSDREVAYIGATGDTRVRDLETGAERVVADGPERGEAFLVDPTGRWATSSLPTFSPVDPATGEVALRPRVGGCDAWLSADGTTGVWIAGSGGPIDAIDLVTRRTWTILGKHDPRLPPDRGYIYFSMLSRDRTLLAVAGSNDVHDHFRADYDVLVVELDPATLDPWSDAVRITAHPGNDRYPDVWRDPTTAPAPPPAVRRSARASGNAEAEGWPAVRDGLVWSRGAHEPQRGHPADADTAGRVAAAIQRSNTVTVELVLEPASLAPDARGVAFALGSGRQLAISIAQRGAVVELRLRTGPQARGGARGGGGPATTLASIPGAGPHHVAFTYSPERLQTYLDGRPAHAPAWTGDFHRLRAQTLTMGSEDGATDRFRGTISHVAVYARELEPEEIAVNAARALASRVADAAVPTCRYEPVAARK
jgi:hypothetical protein